MYDFWEIHIPFKTQFCTVQRVGAGAADIVGVVDLEECGRRGLQLGSKRVDFSIDPEGKLHDLYHPWESVPSSFTDITCKLHQAQLNRSWPCFAIKGSPAKLLQGHNVYGPDCAATGILELIAAFTRALPGIAEMLDFGSAHIRRVDCTYSIQLPDAETMANCLTAIGQLSHRHLRPSKESDYASTIYFNRRTSEMQDAGRAHVLVVYAKDHEMEKQLKSLQAAARKEKTSRYNSVIKSMQSPELQQFAQHRLRFEGRGYTRWFEKNKIPRNVWQFLAWVADFEKREGMKFCEWAWRNMFTDMMTALGDSKVHLTQDLEVQRKLRISYGRCKQFSNDDGSVTEKWNFTRADRLMMFYRLLATEGWDKTKRLTASSSFYDSVKALLDIGLTKAQLQNLRNKKTAKLLHLIKMDFADQRPAGYVEPVGTVLDTQGDMSTLGNMCGKDFVQKLGQSREQLIAAEVAKLSGQPLDVARYCVSHLVAGRPIRLNGELGGAGGEQIHLAVFDDGTWELVRGNVNEYRQEHNLPEPEQRPQYDDDELLADFADYLGAAPNPEFDARSYADAEHRKLSIILDGLRAELYDAEQDPDQIAKAVGLRGRISLTKQRLDRLWYWVHKATDSRGRNISREEEICQE
ncbi:phage/plasmid replication protein, II/X family [Aeromonas sp. FDAARGOS 1418]|uniref:phage/plasmid replication protein, II/X family n=1 Tax=Aeromonas sp. FDAARGOS 1418 TaxID=2778067 RepID=UPI001C235A95|nr:phage/plasmid replication protein, II/X family [Aeromonas sp. FDAARGOS 1418]QXB98135.1 phage/plasmid replication protein, II/X family [Aeromonas sp. FDAARGOS 1418]QXB98145.1 phage/plasmid replication protein, II/X family [Aeromonas sp. FDAARGOS 1418]QXB98155.1 phage/plasmid replication protein, II/X family [Aeromonas sp. FDAARGOS 1418]